MAFRSARKLRLIVCRILDPLLTILLDPRVKRETKTIKLGNREIQIEQHLRAFDIAQHQHVLKNLLSLASFGGQGFTRLAKATAIKQSLDVNFVSRAEKQELAGDNYLDALTAILVIILRSESSASSSGRGHISDQRLHATASDLLQTLVSRGDVEMPGLQAIEGALITRLYICIHNGQQDLQNKLLHVLHSTIAAMGTARKRRDRRSTIGEKTAIGKDVRLSLDRLGPYDPSIAELLCDGIAGQHAASSALLHHWVDFLLMTLPHLRGGLNMLLLPVIERLAAQMEAFLEEMELVYDPNKKGKAKSRAGEVNDADFAVLLNALERLFAVALEEAKSANSQEDDATTSERPQTAEGHSGGFLGYISTALGTADGSVGPSDATPKVCAVYEGANKCLTNSSQAKAAISSRLAEFIGLLLRAWNSSTHLELLCDADESISQGYTSTRVKGRATKAFERIYKTNPADILEVMSERWQVEQDGQQTLPQSVSSCCI